MAVAELTLTQGLFSVPCSASEKLLRKLGEAWPGHLRDIPYHRTSYSIFKLGGIGQEPLPLRGSLGIGQQMVSMNCVSLVSLGCSLTFFLKLQLLSLVVVVV